jgi:hypothetical protein
MRFLCGSYRHEDHSPGHGGRESLHVRVWHLLFAEEAMAFGALETWVGLLLGKLHIEGASIRDRGGYVAARSCSTA